MISMYIILVCMYKNMHIMCLIQISRFTRGSLVRWGRGTATTYLREYSFRHTLVKVITENTAGIGINPNTDGIKFSSTIYGYALVNFEIPY